MYTVYSLSLDLAGAASLTELGATRIVWGRGVAVKAAHDDRRVMYKFQLPKGKAPHSTRGSTGTETNHLL